VTVVVSDCAKELARSVAVNRRERRLGLVEVVARNLLGELVEIVGASEQDRDLYVMINAYWEALTFIVTEGAVGEWARVVDTSQDSPNDIVEAGHELPLGAGTYDVGPRSIVVLLRNRGT
jgi:pullulanase/glycogen debranching enzyme